MSYFGVAIDVGYRVVLAPLTRCRGVNGLVQPAHVKYYSQRTTKGGFLIAEATLISDTAAGYDVSPSSRTFFSFTFDKDLHHIKAKYSPTFRMPPMKSLICWVCFYVLDMRIASHVSCVLLSPLSNHCLHAKTKDTLSHFMYASLTILILCKHFLNA